MKSSVLLIINTTATYTRSLLAVILALLSSRWILNGLGDIDYGLFVLVGSVLLFISYLNLVLAGSSSRHFAYSIGQGDFKEVKGWFGAALTIHLGLALFLAAIGWFSCDFVILHLLNIPQDREIACFFVYRISLISLFTGMISVPFEAMFRAKQHIVEISVWNMLQTILSFFLAYYILTAPGDRLITYSVGMVFILVLVNIGKIVRALLKFEECRVFRSICLEWGKVKEIFSFASWNLIGVSGLIFRNEGSAVILNVYFGPSVNAAYGISKRIVNHVDQLAVAMLGAFSPEITAREGRGERSRMIRLCLSASKFGTLLVLVFLPPLMSEMEYILELWLITPPDFTETFCRLILTAFLIDRLTTGYMLAINAKGRIAAYQATVGTVLLLTLPLAWLFVSRGFPPTSVGGAFIITMLLVSMGRIFWAKRLLNVTVARWMKAVAFPCILVGGGSMSMAFLPHFFFPAGYLRLLVVVGGSGISFLIMTWFFAFNNDERSLVLSMFKKMRNRVSL